LLGEALSLPPRLISRSDIRARISPRREDERLPANQVA
jgi:hypothetical protein